MQHVNRVLRLLIEYGLEQWQQLPIDNLEMFGAKYGLKKKWFTYGGRGRRVEKCSINRHICNCFEMVVNCSASVSHFQQERQATIIRPNSSLSHVYTFCFFTTSIDYPFYLSFKCLINGNNWKVITFSRLIVATPPPMTMKKLLQFQRVYLTCAWRVSLDNIVNDQVCDLDIYIYLIYIYIVFISMNE